MAAVCALAAALAAAMLIPSPPLFRLSPIPPQTAFLQKPPWPIICGMLLGVPVAANSGPLFAIATGVPAAVVAWLIMGRSGKKSTRRNAEVARACAALAGLLRMGHIPPAALEVVAKDEPVLALAAAASQVGGDIAQTMRLTALTQGYETLADVADAWQIAERTGASLSEILGAVSLRLEAQDKVKALVNAELSSTRATSKLLAALPLAGLGLGFALGGDPVQFLTSSIGGQLVLVAGVCLAAIGLVWVEKIANVHA
jgi:tight adherence protein B